MKEVENVMSSAMIDDPFSTTRCMQDMCWQCGDRLFDLSQRTLVMGIINVTPDSFSDGGQFCEPHVAVHHGLRLLEQGADILDVGGESTRPGSVAVSIEAELERVMPVIEGLRRQAPDAVISIDTKKAAVARQAIEAGASVINDITALAGDPEMPMVAARSGVAVVLMHMQGTPATMQCAPLYEDVVAEVRQCLNDRLEAAIANGIAPQRIILDPGIGFGKTVEHNLELIRRLDELATLPRPLLIGPSRKSFIGKVLDAPVECRAEGTAAVIAAAILKGARVVRVHDVAAMTRVARMVDALMGRLPARDMSGCA
jgi:dihydropteroate synthase